MEQQELQEATRRLRERSETENTAIFLPDDACIKALSLMDLGGPPVSKSRNEVS